METRYWVRKDALMPVAACIDADRQGHCVQVVIVHDRYHTCLRCHQRKIPAYLTMVMYCNDCRTEQMAAMSAECGSERITE